MIRLLPCLINGVKSFLFNPANFIRQPSFLFIWGVYGGTYVIANSVEAICERNNRSSFYPKFIGSSVANVSFSIVKDRAFARMFGKGGPRPMPYSCFGLFAGRDSMTILASFSLPGLIARKLESDFAVNSKKADVAAQLITPVSMQIFSTPLHLAGLDLYNRSGVTFYERFSFISQEYAKTTLARMARIFPAFGIGGVVNKKIRAYGRQWIDEHYSTQFEHHDAEDHIGIHHHA